MYRGTEAVPAYTAAGDLGSVVRLARKAHTHNHTCTWLQTCTCMYALRRYAEAVPAYEAAGDLDSVVRLALEKLGAPQRAYAIVRKTRSVEAAKSLCKYCLQVQDFQVGGRGHVCRACACDLVARGGPRGAGHSSPWEPSAL